MQGAAGEDLVQDDMFRKGGLRSPYGSPFYHQVARHVFVGKHLTLTPSELAFLNVAVPAALEHKTLGNVQELEYKYAELLDNANDMDGQEFRADKEIDGRVSVLTIRK